ncbi:MAG: hypothetical protein Q8P04_01010 [bacterium]|nr:hypothetical protein [bacterium]
MRSREKGQSLAELLIGVAIVIIIISSIVGAVIVVVRSNLQSTATRTAAALGQELADGVRSVAEGKWSNLYSVSPKGASTTYRVTASGTPPVLTVVSGSEEVVVNNFTYTRFFSVENVNRDSAQNIAASGTEDPSTQKITISVRWQLSGQTAELTTAEYFTRSRNEVTRFTDWSGASSTAGPITSPDSNYFSKSNLDATSTAGALKLP